MRILDTAKDSWARADADNLGLLAAGVAFYAFLAMVPLLAAMVLTYGLVADPADVVEQAAAVARTLPQSAAEIVIDQMRGLAAGDTGKTALGLVIALGTAIFGATKGAKAVIVALNIVNNVDQKRGFIGQTRASVLIILLLLATLLAGFGAVAALSLVETVLPSLPGWATGAIKWVGWLTFAVIATVSLSIIYHYGPAAGRPPRKPSFAGAVVASILLGIGTIGFAIYVRNFGSYNATYGALGAVVVLQLWLYLAAYALLFGAEIAQSKEARAD
ncbi:YihY/virulence factor BrkB family protein [Sphingomicrobium sp. XHP0239]|uniref:YihY/virulence factor BrkB family protein n=1 Tax=Sphingomicrobium maritimum TaxID=3133972 RepID=UPI0031CCD98C